MYSAYYIMTFVISAAFMWSPRICDISCPNTHFYTDIFRGILKQGHGGGIKKPRFSGSNVAVRGNAVMTVMG
jgi:hypothetical protein